MDSKINDNKNNIETSNTKSEKTIRTQHNRDDPVYKRSEIQNNNKNDTIPLTQSRIISEDQSTTSDLEEKINLVTKDFPILKTNQNTTTSIQEYTSKKFLQKSSNKNLNNNPHLTTTTNTSKIEIINNPIIQYTSPVIF